MAFYKMRARKTTLISLLLLLCSLLFSNGHIYALQNGSLPLGELSDSGSTITQTEGEYSFYFEENEYFIGEDNSLFKHNFGIFLEIDAFNISKFTIEFQFTTPFHTLEYRRSSFIFLDNNNEIDFTPPSYSNSSNFQYTFNPIEGSVYIGRIEIELTLGTVNQMREIFGNEKIEIEFINGTSSSISLEDFEINQVEYITTTGSDNALVPINFFTFVIALLILPLLKRFGLSRG